MKTHNKNNIKTLIFENSNLSEINPPDFTGTLKVHDILLSFNNGKLVNTTIDCSNSSQMADRY